MQKKLYLVHRKLYISFFFILPLFRVTLRILCVNGPVDAIYFQKFQKKGLPRLTEKSKMRHREFARWCTGTPKITGVGVLEKTWQH